MAPRQDLLLSQPPLTLRLQHRHEVEAVAGEGAGEGEVVEEASRLREAIEELRRP